MLLACTKGQNPCPSNYLVKVEITTVESCVHFHKHVHLPEGANMDTLSGTWILSLSLVPYKELTYNNGAYVA